MAVWSKAVKPAGWSDRLARRRADDERLLQDFAHNGGRGRASQDVERARSWVRHVRDDIGPNGVITSVEVRPDEVAACFYMEPDPEQPGAAGAAVPPTQVSNYWTAGQPAATGQSSSAAPASGQLSALTALSQISTPPTP